MSLCHWVGCAAAERLEAIQSTQGTLLEYVQPLQSLEWGPKLMLLAAVNVTLLARGRGVQKWEEMPRDGLWLTSLCCLIKAMSRTAQGVKKETHF